MTGQAIPAGQGAPSGLTGPGLAAARGRARWTLVVSVALGSTGHIAAVTVATIVANDLLGSRTLAGAPGAGIVLGAALGSVLLSRLMARHGRRIGLVTGYAGAVIGALIATTAVLVRSFPLLLGGVALLGFGNASNQLSRYTAADMVPSERRASAIGIVVWASTVGSIAGPSLVPVAGRLAGVAGLPTLAGPYLLPVAFAALAGLLGFVLLRPDPYQLADVTAPDERTAPGDRSLAAPIGTILRRPGVAAAIVALVVGQLVMVLIMTMTPLHMTEHGSDLTAVGIVLSGHTLGMFALSPLSGRLTDRFGAVPTIFGGTALLAGSSLLAAAAPAEGGPGLIVALFLLGWGWNLGFVAGSALLSQHLEVHERTRVQGVADALIWSSAAAASLGSGVIMATVGYAALGVLGAGLVAIPVVVLRAHGRARREPVERAPGEVPEADVSAG